MFYTNVSHLLNPELQLVRTTTWSGYPPVQKSIIPEFIYYSNAL